MRAFVVGATAAAAGAIAGAIVVLARRAVVDVSTAAVAVICLAVLWRVEVKKPYVMLACTLPGIALHR